MNSGQCKPPITHLTVAASNVRTLICLIFLELASKRFLSDFSGRNAWRALCDWMPFALWSMGWSAGWPAGAAAEEKHFQFPAAPSSTQSVRVYERGYHTSEGESHLQQCILGLVKCRSPAEGSTLPVTAGAYSL